MSVTVNGEKRELEAGTTFLSELMVALGKDGKTGIAVAINGTVVPQTGWTEQVLTDGDSILVIQATQGG
tara:strand:+ start:2369 stop:2575 length:207 start_codon:yes stop_codon:yes gene_type:complete